MKFWSCSKMKLPKLTWWGALKLLILLVLAASIVTLLLLFFIPGSPLEDAFLNFLEWLESIPTWQAAIILTLFQTVAVILILPGTPLNLAAGFLFEVWLGSIVSVASTDVAAVVSFLIGRYLARDWAEKQIATRPKFRAIDQAVERQGMWIIILVRLSPVFPFGLCNYLFGLTKVGFWKYWIATTIGLLPYTIAYTYLGSLMRELTEIFTEDAGDSTQQIILLSVGGGVTLITIILVSLITRAALKRATREQADLEAGSSEDARQSEADADYQSIPDNPHLEEAIIAGAGGVPSTRQAVTNVVVDDPEVGLLSSPGHAARKEHEVLDSTATTHQQHHHDMKGPVAEVMTFKEKECHSSPKLNEQTRLVD